MASALKRDICIRLRSDDTACLNSVRELSVKNASDTGSAVKLYLYDKKAMIGMKSIKCITLTDELLGKYIDAAGHGNVRFMMR